MTGKRQEDRILLRALKDMGRLLSSLKIIFGKIVCTGHFSNQNVLQNYSLQKQKTLLIIQV
jgi:hypothetical protein